MSRPLTNEQLRAWGFPELIQSQAQAEPQTSASDSNQTTSRTPERSDAREDLLRALGSLVSPLLRDAEGKLDLSKIQAENFDEFRQWLQDQVSVDGIAFNDHLLASYHRVLGKAEHEPLLRMLWEKKDTTSEGAWRAALNKLTADLISVSAERFVASRLGDGEGRRCLRGILGDRDSYSRELRIDLMKAIAAVGERQGSGGLYSHQSEKQISSWNYFNWGVNEAELTRAEHFATEILSAADEQEADLHKARSLYLEHPEKVRALGTKTRTIAPEEIRRFARMEDENREKPDPVAALRTRLARLWLMAADSENWRDENAYASRTNRSYLLAESERLLSLTENVRDEAGLRWLNERVQEFLAAPLPPEDSESGVWQKAWRWAEHKAVGHGLEELFEVVPEGRKSPYLELKQLSDTWKYSVEMDETIFFEPEAESKEAPLARAVSHLSSELRKSKQQFWYSYKQHKALSRGLSNVASWFGGGDIEDIREANRWIDGALGRLAKVRTQDELKEELNGLYRELKKGGKIFAAMEAAEMEGVEQLVGLLQTVAEIAAITLATEGMGTVGAVADAARAGRVLQGAVETGISAQRLAQGASWVSKAEYGMKMGMTIATTENAVAVASGEVRERPETLLAWGKDGLATGAAMSLFGPLSMGEGSAHVSRNLAKGLVRRYLGQGVKGLSHFAKDTAAETGEELLDAHLRQGLDGQQRALGIDQIREITLVCGFGGAQMGALGYGFQRFQQRTESSVETLQSSRSAASTAATSFRGNIFLSPMWMFLGAGGPGGGNPGPGKKSGSHAQRLAALHTQLEKTYAEAGQPLTLRDLLLAGEVTTELSLKLKALSMEEGLRIVYADRLANDEDVEAVQRIIRERVEQGEPSSANAKRIREIINKESVTSLHNELAAREGMALDVYLGRVLQNVKNEEDFDLLLADFPLDFKLALIRDHKLIQGLDQSLEGLKNRDRDVRLLAIEALETLGNRSDTVERALLRRLNDGSKFVRRKAIEALGSLGFQSRAVENALLKRTNAPDSLIRARAALALERLGFQGEVLERTLLWAFHKSFTYTYDILGNDRGWGIRTEIAEALARLGFRNKEVEEKLLRELEGVSDETIKILREWGYQSEAVDRFLLERLENENREVRERAALALGRLGFQTTAAEGALLNRVKDWDDSVGVYAAEALVRWGFRSKAVFQALLENLDGSKSHLQVKAMESLGRFGLQNQALEHALLKRLDHPADPDVRAKAVETLVRLGFQSQPVKRAFLKQLNNWDPRMRRETTKALDRLFPGWDQRIREEFLTIREELDKKNSEAMEEARLPLNNLMAHIPSWDFVEDSFSSYIPGPENLHLAPSTAKALQGVVTGILINIPVYLFGETGTGKNAMLRYLAHRTGTPLLRINFNRETDDSQLFGHFAIEADEQGRRRVVVRDGKMIQAMKHGAWMLWDEANLASEAFLVAQNDLIQQLETGSVTVRQGGKLVTVDVHPHFRLFATGNPEGYAGRKATERSFGNRWLKLFVKPMTVEEQQAFLATGYPNLSPENAERIPSVLHALKLVLGAERVTIRTLMRVAGRIEATEPAGLRAYVAAIEAEILDGLNPEEYAQTLQALALALPLNGRNLEDIFSQAPSREEFEAKVGEYSELLDRDGRGGQNENQEEEEPKNPEAEADWGEYVPVPTFLKYASKALDSLIRGDHLLIEGPPATSKSSFAALIGWLAGQKVIEATGSADHSIAELIGMPALDEQGQLIFQKGYFLEALEEGAVLIVNEANLIPAEVLERLNSVFDDDRMIVVSESGREAPVKAHPNFRLVLTQNPAGMNGGRKHHSPALENKFRKIFIRDGFRLEELEQIVGETMPRLEPLASSMVQAYVEAAKILAADHEIVNLRDLQRWGLIATALTENYVLGPSEAVLLGTEVVYLGRNLDLETRDELQPVFKRLEASLAENKKAAGLRTDSDFELRQAVRKILAKEGTLNLRSIYEHFAESQKMNLDVWLGRVFKKGSAVELENLFQELGWDSRLQIEWIDQADIEGGRISVERVLRDSNQNLRSRAAEILGRLGDSKAIPTLERALSDSDSNVRGIAAEALGRLGNSTARFALERALSDSDSNVRLGVAEALGRLGDVKACPALERALSDSDSNVRLRAAEALGRLGNSTGRFALEGALSDFDRNVRAKAAEALGRLGDNTVRSALERALRDSDSDFRSSAAEALGQLGDSTARLELELALRDFNTLVRRSAAKALGRLGDSAARSTLECALSDKFYIVRLEATEALGRLGDIKACPALERALGDSDSNVRLRAAEALGRLGDSTGRLFLENALSDSDRFVRWGAAEILGRLGNPASCSALERALKNSDDLLQWRIVRSLDKLRPGWDADLFENYQRFNKILAEEMSGLLVDAQSAQKARIESLLKAAEIQRDLPLWQAKGAEARSLATHVPGEAALFLGASTANALQGLVGGVLARLPVYLTGETGTGKNAMLRHLAHLTGTPLLRINFNRETDVDQLFGHFEVERNDRGQRRVVVRDGKMIQAMKHGAWMLWDEANLASESFLVAQNDLIQQLKSGKVTVRQGGKLVTIDVHPHFRLFATGNPAGYAGRKTTERSFGNRWLKLFVKPMSVEEQQAFLATEYPNLSPENAERIPSVLHALKIVLGAEKVTIRTLKRVTGQIEAMEPADMQAYVTAIEAEILDGLNPEEYDRAVPALALALPGGEGLVSDHLNRAIGNEDFFADVEKYRESLQTNAILQNAHWESLVPVPTTVRYAQKVLDSFKRGDQVLIEGPPALSKSAIPKWLGKLLKQAVIEVTGSPDHSASEMIGMPTLDEQGNLVFQEGYFLKALKEGAILVLNEANLIPADVLERLNSVFDDDKAIVVSENGQETPVKAHPDFRLVLTQNPAGMNGGRRRHSPALENKFRKIYIREGFAPEELIAIARENFPGLAPAAESMVGFHQDVAKHFVATGENLTLRDWIHWGLIASRLTDTAALPPGEALPLGAALVYWQGKADREGQGHLQERLAQLGIELSQTEFPREDPSQDPETDFFRNMIRKSLSKTDVTSLKEVYESLAAEESLDLTVYLGRILRGLNQEQLEALIQQADGTKWDELLWIGAASNPAAQGRLFELMNDSRLKDRERQYAWKLFNDLALADPEGNRTLLKGLRDEDKDVRVWALRAVSRLGLTDAELRREILNRLGKDESVEVRILALEVLVSLEIEDEEARCTFMDSLRDEDDEDTFSVQVPQIVGDFNLVNEEVRKALVDFLGNENEELRIPAASLLARLGFRDEKVKRALLKQLRSEDRKVPTVIVLGYLGQADEEVKRALLDVREDNILMRQQILLSLGGLNLRDEELKRALLEGLRDDHHGARQCAVKALESSGLMDQEVKAALLERLSNDEEMWVRFKIARFLGRSGWADQEVKRALLNSLRHEGDDADWVAREAIPALGRLGLADEEVKQALLSELTRKRMFHTDAADALGLLGLADEELRQTILAKLKENPRKEYVAFLDRYFPGWDREILSRFRKFQGVLSEELSRPQGEMDEAQRVLVEKLLKSLPRWNSAAAQEPIPLRQTIRSLLRQEGVVNLHGVYENFAKEKGMGLEVFLAKGISQDEVTVLELLKQLSWSNEEKIWWIGRYKIKAGIAFLEGALEDISERVRYNAAAALGEFDKSRAYDLLERVLGSLDDKGYVFYDAEEALGKLLETSGYNVLERALGSQHSEVRRFAINALDKLGDARAFPLLMQAFEDENEEVRESAVIALGKSGDARAVPLLMQAFEDENEEVRDSAVFALGRLGDARAIPLVEQLLEEEDKRVRGFAASILGKIGDARAFSLLEQYLGDEDEDVRALAMARLGELGDARAFPLLVQVVGDEHEGSRQRAKAVLALGLLGDPRAIPLLERVLGDGEKRVRSAAATVLGKLGKAKSVPFLAKALDDKEWMVRSAATEALKNLRDASAVPLLEKTLRDEYWGIRDAAAKALGYMGNAKAVPLLAKALDDKVWMVRRSATEALDKLGDASAVPFLEKALGDENWEVRDAAAKAFGKLGDSRAVPFLKQSLGDEDKFVQQAAAEALDKVAPGWNQELQKEFSLLQKMIHEELSVRLKEVDQSQKVHIEKLLASLPKWVSQDSSRETIRRILQDPEVHDAAQIHRRLAKERQVSLPVWLGYFLKEASQEELEAILDHWPDDLPPWPEEWIGQMGLTQGIPYLIRSFRTKGAEHRERRLDSIVALGRLGIANPQVEEVLIQAVKGPSEEMWLLALPAIRKLGLDSPVIQAALEPFFTAYQATVRREVAETWAALNFPVSPRLLKTLGDLAVGSGGVLEKRIEAARALEALRPPGSVEILRRMMGDREDLAQIAAAESLGKMGVDLEKVRELLFKHLTGNSSESRIAAAQAIARLKWEGADFEKPLLSRIRAKSHGERCAMIAALGVSQNPGTKVRTALLNALRKDRHFKVRLAAAEVLGLSAQPISEVEDFFEATLRDNEIKERLKAWQAIGRLAWRSPRLESLLLESRQAYPWDREEAMKNLVSLGIRSKAAKQALLSELKEENASISFAAMHALDQLFPAWDEEMKSDMPQIREILGEELSRKQSDVVEEQTLELKTLATGLAIWSPPGEYLKARWQEYIPGAEKLFIAGSTVETLQGLIGGIMAQLPVYLTGETGTGKNVMLRHLAHLTGTPLLRINFNRETDAAQLLGHFEIERDAQGRRRVVVRDGKMIQAMKHGAWMLWDEANLASESFLVAQNDLIQQLRTGKVTVRQGGKLVTIEVHPHFRLFATGNPEGYAGRKGTERSFGNRWLKLFVKPMSVEEQQAFLATEYPALSLESAEAIPAILHALKLAIGGERVTLRTLKRVAQRIAERESEGKNLWAAGSLSDLGMEAYGAALEAEILDALNPEAYGKAVEALALALPRGGRALSDYLNREVPAEEFFAEVQDYGKVVAAGQTRAPAAKAAWEELVPVPTTVKYARKVLDSFRRGDAVLLEGPPALSKSSIPKWLGKLLNQDVIEATGSPDQGSSEWIGTPSFDEEGNLVFQEGYFLRALKEGAILVLNEANLIPADVLERLNSVFDDDKMIVVSENNQESPVKAHPNFRLVLTQNPAGMNGGRVRHSPALENKFRKIFLRETFSREELEAIVAAALKPEAKPPTPLSRGGSRSETPKRSRSPQHRLSPAAHPLSTRISPAMGTARWFAAIRPATPAMNSVFERKGRKPPPEERRLTAAEQKRLEDKAAAATEEVLARIDAFMSEHGETIENLGSLAAMKRVHVKVDVGGEVDMASLNLETGELLINPLAASQLSAGEIAALALHEGGHGAISRLGNGYFFEKRSRHLLANCLEDPRVNEYALARLPGARESFSSLYERFFPRTKTAPTREPSEAPLGQLPHEQFALGFLELWANGRLSERIDHPEVQSALQTLEPFARRIWETLPHLYHPQEKEILAKQNEVYSLIREHILPAYEGFYQSSLAILEENMRTNGAPGEGRPAAGVDIEDLSASARELLERRASRLAERLEPQESSGRRRKAVERIRSRGADGVDSGEQKGSGSLYRESDFKPYGEKTVGDLLKERIRRKADREAFYDRNPWRRSFDPVASIAAEIAESLRLILRLDADFDYEGHYVSGSRLDVRKAVETILKNEGGLFSENDLKLFLRKRFPTKRSHKFVLLLDESGSMKGDAQAPALQAVALFHHVLEALRVDHAVAGFSDTPNLHKEFSEQDKSDAAKNALMVEMETAGGGGTNDLAGLKLGAELLAGQDAEEKTIIVVTDGQGVDTTAVYVKELEAAGIKVIGIGIGTGTDSVKQVYGDHYQSQNFRDLPKTLLRILARRMLGVGFEENKTVKLISGEPEMEPGDEGRIPTGGSLGLMLPLTGLAPLLEVARLLDPRLTMAALDSLIPALTDPVLWNIAVGLAGLGLGFLAGRLWGKKSKPKPSSQSFEFGEAKKDPYRERILPRQFDFGSLINPKKARVVAFHNNGEVKEVYFTGKQKIGENSFSRGFSAVLAEDGQLLFLISGWDSLEPVAVKLNGTRISANAQVYLREDLTLEQIIMPNHQYWTLYGKYQTDPSAPILFHSNGKLKSFLADDGSDDTFGTAFPGKFLFFDESGRFLGAGDRQEDFDLFFHPPKTPARTRVAAESDGKAIRIDTMTDPEAESETVSAAESEKTPPKTQKVE